MKLRPAFPPTLFAALMLALLLALPSGATAQELYVSNIQGTFAPGKVSPGETITVTIAVDMSGAPSNLVGVSLGWVIDSQDGATWDTVVIGEPASFDYYDYFDFLRQHTWFNPPPGMDTVWVGYSRLFYDGIPVGDSVEFVEIEFGPINGPLGATITLDSATNFGLSQLAWMVNVAEEPVEVNPTFDALTFEIAECCVGGVGNIDGGLDDNVNLTDVTIMANSLFRTFEPFICPAEANCNGDPAGDINLSDITALINHLFISFEPLPACP